MESVGESGTPSYLPGVPKNLLSKQDLNPFSHFGTAMDMLTDRHRTIDRKSPHLTQSMQPKNYDVF